MKRILICMLLLTACSKPQVKRSIPPVSVKTATAYTKDVKIYEQTVGHMEGYNSVDIQAQVTGVLTQALFTQGASIKKGDLILTIDDRPYRAALEKAEADLERILAELKFAQDTTKRNTPLVQDEYISEQTYEQLLTEVLVDEAGVRQKMAEIETAKINLGYCYIYAPMDSICGVRRIDPGNLILTEAAETIVTLEQIKPIYCTIFISEKLLPRLQNISRKGKVSIESSFDETFSEIYTGFLEFIDNRVNESTGMIKLRATYENFDEKLWPGEYVNVRIILEDLKDAVLVPAQAIQTGTMGKYVFVVRDNNTVERKTVTLGQREGDDIIVLSGLKKGDEVVIEGQFNLLNGSKVERKEL